MAYPAITREEAQALNRCLHNLERQTIMPFVFENFSPGIPAVPLDMYIEEVRVEVEAGGEARAVAFETVYGLYTGVYDYGEPIGIIAVMWFGWTNLIDEWTDMLQEGILFTDRALPCPFHLWR